MRLFSLKCRLLVALFVALSALPVRAQSIDDILLGAYYGHAESQYMLGVCYLTGDEVPHDVEEGEKWLIEAANSGDADIQAWVGEIYLRGEIIEQSYEDAIKWCDSAMKKGSGMAARLLSEMYYGGKGVQRDVARAVELLRLGAERNDVDSMYLLFGLMFSDVGVSFDEGMENLFRAAEMGHLQSQYELGKAYELGYMVDQDYNMAVNWYTRAAMKGYAYAQRSLGLMYYHGVGVNVDLEAAINLFTAAAKQGDAEAQFVLGECYYHGIGVEVDREEAYIWLRKAMEQEYEPAFDYFG
jgi:TPR repeat protein